MRNVLLILLLVCVLSVAQSYRRHHRARLSDRPRGIVLLQPWSGKSLISKITPVPPVQPVDVNSLGSTNGTNYDLKSILGLGGIAGGIQSGLGDLAGGLTSGLDKLNPVALMKFLTDQISYFKDKTMYIYDDQERPVQLKLEIPDFNLLNLWPDMNKKVTFSLYDKQGGNNSFDILKVDDIDALKKSRFNSNKPTVFITHGFLASSNGSSVTLVRDAYLKKRDYNVIAVNWSPLSVGSYTVARLMVPRVGTHVGNMINFLYKNGMNPNKTNLIGHSLGAHVMGLAGQTATQKVNHTIALDPAWPLFVLLPQDQRISDDDAQYVEVIHTNGGLLGLPKPTGHYDFYPNGGFFQKGCDGEVFTACSHSRSYKYLVEQMEEEGSDYYAVQCNSYKRFEEGRCSNNKNVTIMGALDRVDAAKGNYYLDTNDKEPFGLGLMFQELTVQSYRRHHRARLSYRPRGIVLLQPWSGKSLISKIIPVTPVQPVDINNLGSTNGTNHDLNGILGLGGTAGGIQSGLSDLAGRLTSGLDKLNPIALIKFLTDQISFFKDKIMYIYDDQERPVQLKLEIPDFKLLNLWPDLNKKVTFSLYDKQGGNNSFDILKVDDNDALKKSRFNSNKPTVFITHGFLASSNGSSVTLVRDAYLKKRDYNVIAANWSPLSVGSYSVARLMVPRVGTHVGNMINFLYKNGMNPKRTKLIGHSLGAHVMGLAGQTATQKVNHAIALDPAWPLFVLLPQDQRVSDNDAQYVEVIHTNGGLLGLPETTGHYDFYPNGGFFQKGCDGEVFTACSHSRSYKYLVEQMEEEGSDYYAVQCDSYKKFEERRYSNNKNVTIMGALDRVDAEKGKYYLDTNDKEPFGLGLTFQELTG